MTPLECIQDISETIAFQARLDTNNQNVVRCFLDDCFQHGADYKNVIDVYCFGENLTKALSLDKEFSVKLINAGVFLYNQGVIAQPVIEV